MAKLILNPQGLLDIANDMTAEYELGADIDLKGIDWIPLGTSATQSSSSQTAFTGKLNGNGFTIYNLTINRSTSDTYNFVGLFGKLGACTIQDLVIRKAKVAVRGANPCVGILAGHIYYATANISHVSVEGNMQIDHKYKYDEYAYRGVAGMVGSAYCGYSTFTDCTADVNIKISGCDNRTCYVAGFIGYGDEVKLTRCFAFGTIVVINTVDTLLKISGMQSRCHYTTHTNCACAVNIFGASADTVSECCKYLTSTSSFKNNNSRRYWENTSISWESYASSSDTPFAESDITSFIEGYEELYNQDSIDMLDFANGNYLRLDIDYGDVTDYSITINGITYHNVSKVICNGKDVSKLIVDGAIYKFK